MPSTHALLSASSSSRWLHCTPSAVWESKLEDQTSPYAEEGTKAHALAEKRLRHFLRYGKLLEDKPSYVEEEMWEATGRYVDIVIEKMTEARRISPDAQVLIEHRLDYSDWAPLGFGTGDAVIVSDDGVEVIDLKYGKGVPVSAIGNSQMRLYALGAYADLSLVYELDRVTMTIVQPRLDSVSTETLTADELLAWGRDVVVPRAQLAAKGKGEPEPGPHCKFCKKKPTCKALGDYMMKKYEAARAQDPTDMTPEQIAQLVLGEKDLKGWLDAVSAYALEKALEGKEWPGLKVVEGRSNRKLADADEAARLLSENGYTDAAIYKPRELQTITALEKGIGKKAFAGILGDLIVKPKGKPTLVADSDKRPAMALDVPTKDDFDDSLLD